MIKFNQSKRTLVEIVNFKNVIIIFIIFAYTYQYVNCLQQQQHRQQQQVSELTNGLFVSNQNNPLLTQSSSSSSPSQPQAQSQSQSPPTTSDTTQAASMNPNASNNSNNNKPANLNNAKSNHRLVNKIKDARHRRRNRHHRHRHHRHSNHLNNQQLGNDRQSDTVQAAAAMTLTALESIVEEVARAGQLTSVVSLHSAQAPTVAQAQHQHQQQQQQSNQVTVVAASQQQQQQQQVQMQAKQVTGNNVIGGNNISPSTSVDANTLLNVSMPVPQVQASSASNNQLQQQPKVSTALQQQIAKGPPYGSRGFFLTSMLSKIMNVLNVTEFALEMRDGISSRASCMACNAVVGLFLSPLYSKDVFSAAIRTVCTSFKIQSPRVCAGLTASFEDDFEYIRKNTKLSRDEVCGVVFGVDCARRQTYNLFWTVPIPELPVRPIESTSTNKGLTLPMNEQSLTNMDDAPDLFEYRKSGTLSPTTVGSNANSNKQTVQDNSMHSSATSLQKETQIQQTGSTTNPRQQRSKSSKLLKRSEYIFDDDFMDNNAHDKKDKPISSFVHLTDIHIDPYYEPGSLNDCGEPLCCRATSGPVPLGDKRRQAGRWGDYGNCDVPIRTLHNALNRIREQHSNAEYWLWTGDISPHDIWNISKSEAAHHVRLVTKMVRDYSSGVPVFPVIGNHEAHPVNSFSPPEIKGKFSMSWLYDLLADEWSDWLPADALKTLRIGGYYKLQVRRGFRILALNTNYCARLNPWSFYDPVDPANQLKWLVDELLEAELNQDKVHLIGHVPPDNRECTQAWLFNFINIIDRFKDTIVAQFYGHTHRDEWRVIYSLARNDDPIGIQFIGPSITPFTENNPSYRIYHQDKSGYIIDSETYYFNLTEANETPTSEPQWRYSYSTRQHLNLTLGLASAEWHNYLQKMHEDDDLFDVFYKNFYRHSDVKMGMACRAKCKYQMLSDLRLSHPYKTKPKPFLANRKTSNHHRDRHDNHHQHHHYHHRRLKHLE